MKRAKSAGEKTRTGIALSPLEGVSSKAVLADLSAEALKEYRAAAKIRGAVGSPGFNQLMRQQGLLAEHGGAGPHGFRFPALRQETAARHASGGAACVDSVSRRRG